MPATAANNSVYLYDPATFKLPAEAAFKYVETPGITARGIQQGEHILTFLDRAALQQFLKVNKAALEDREVVKYSGEGSGPQLLISRSPREQLAIELEDHKNRLAVIARYEYDQDQHFESPLHSKIFMDYVAGGRPAQPTLESAAATVKEKFAALRA